MNAWGNSFRPRRDSDLIHITVNPALKRWAIFGADAANYYGNTAPWLTAGDRRHSFLDSARRDQLYALAVSKRQNRKAQNRSVARNKISPSGVSLSSRETSGSRWFEKDAWLLGIVLLLTALVYANSLTGE